MRFYQPHTQFYCAIDLHTRNMYPRILTRDNDVLFHREMKLAARLQTSHLG